MNERQTKGMLTMRDVSSYQMTTFSQWNWNVAFNHMCICECVWMDGAVCALSAGCHMLCTHCTISSLEPVHMFGVSGCLCSTSFEYRCHCRCAAVLHRIFWLVVGCVVRNLFFVAIIVADVTITAFAYSFRRHRCLNWSLWNAPYKGTSINKRTILAFYDCCGNVALIRLFFFPACRCSCRCRCCCCFRCLLLMCFRDAVSFLFSALFSVHFFCFKYLWVCASFFSHSHCQRIKKYWLIYF